MAVAQQAVARPQASCLLAADQGLKQKDQDKAWALWTVPVVWGGNATLELGTLVQNSSVDSSTTAAERCMRQVEVVAPSIAWTAAQQLAGAGGHACASASGGIPMQQHPPIDLTADD